MGSSWAEKIVGRRIKCGLSPRTGNALNSKKKIINAFVGDSDSVFDSYEMLAKITI